MLMLGLRCVSHDGGDLEGRGPKIFGEEITKKYAGEEGRVEGPGECVACALSWVLIKQIAKLTV